MSNKAAKSPSRPKVFKTGDLGVVSSGSSGSRTVRLWDHAFECGQRKRDGNSHPAIIYRIQDGLRAMIRKLKSGEYRLYSRKKNPKTGKRRNLGTFSSLAKAREHERAVQFFKRH